MPKKFTIWTIWLVLALALLGQTVSAGYGVAQICESLVSESMPMTGGDLMPHDMVSQDTKNCCEDSSNGKIGSCEMHSCVIVGLQSCELEHSVTFNTSQTHLDLQYQHVLVTLDSLYRPPILI